MLWPIIGTIAAICTTVGFIPQIIRGIKTRELSDVSPIMLTLLLVGCSLWLIYGIHLKNPIIALANGFTLSFVVTIFLLRVMYKRNNSKR
ncbi:MAG: MtN3 and saliva related transrane protein [Candidatus Poribacteria bacterium]|jgi:MtN3 and saliva related transmembrane protein|nr:MtN3 and saliva related transrane protein [Planctomycetota bacterium]MDQ1316459.1 MtN3 and saliva related transrane protein [Candidatus Poribacteria bacterium]